MLRKKVCMFVCACEINLFYRTFFWMCEYFFIFNILISKIYLCTGFECIEEIVTHAFLCFRVLRLKNHFENVLAQIILKVCGTVRKWHWRGRPDFISYKHFTLTLSTFAWGIFHTSHHHNKIPHWSGKSFRNNYILFLKWGKSFYFVKYQHQSQKVLGTCMHKLFIKPANSEKFFKQKKFFSLKIFDIFEMNARIIFKINSNYLILKIATNLNCIKSKIS